MKRLGGLWPEIATFETLWHAYRRARRGKRDRPGVAEFGLDLERNLFQLRDELVQGTYRPGPYRLFTIYERKPRLIAAAPFRDRVVQHAVMAIMEPPLDRRFIFDSYACRTGKGVHQAVARYQWWADRYTYALKLDIARYFPSIDQAILKAKLERRIKDARLLELLGWVIDSSPPTAGVAPGKGMPIGNLLSQFFANLYLDDLDHWIKERLLAPTYLRYVDDMVLLANDKERLWNLAYEIGEHLAADGLRLHPTKVQVTRVADGLDVLGYRVYPGRCLLRNANGHRFTRHLRALARGYAAGRLDWPAIDPSVRAWIGHAGHADTWRLRGRIFSAIVFRRGSGQEAEPGDPRRRVEQPACEAAVREP